MYHRQSRRQLNYYQSALIGFTRTALQRIILRHSWVTPRLAHSLVSLLLSHWISSLSPSFCSPCPLLKFQSICLSAYSVSLWTICLFSCISIIHNPLLTLGFKSLIF